MRNLAFVIPWYAETLGGGAETACRMLAHLLQDSGVNVEVLSTCVKDFRSDWSVNHHAPGTTVEASIPVRRFAVRPRDTQAFDRINAKLMASAAITEDEEETFLREMVHSPSLYDFIAANQESYVYAFMPYMFGTTFAGCRQAPRQSVLIPCLHDEPYARLRTFRQIFTSAAGSIFLSEAERDLALTLYGPDIRVLTVGGLPIQTGWTGNPARFRSNYGIDNFLLYAGRTDPGKGADILINYFGRYVRETGDPLKLVFIGSSDVHVPVELEGRVYTPGFLSEQDKHDCMTAARALCVPSIMESYSIVLMESWVAGTPVIVNERCAVTTGFCRRSNGGLWFGGYEDFRGILQWMAEHPAMAKAMGQHGRAYVVSEFSQDAVARRYMDALGPMLNAPMLSSRAARNQFR